MKVISEGPIRITKATVDTVWRKRSGSSRLIVRDKDCRGLALIVNPTTMTWVYAYRPRGSDPRTGRRWPNRTVTLGNPATLSPDDARTEGNRIKGQAAAGSDPLTEKKARAAEELRKQAATLARLLGEYRNILPRRPKMRGSGAASPAYVTAELAQVAMALADMNATATPAAHLTAGDIRGLLDAAVGVTTARKRFGALSRFLDWCQDAGYISANPCALIARSRRPRMPQPRSNYLTPGELGRLWRAADGLDEAVWRDIVRFLITVPCRRNEASRLDWSHLDLAAAEWRQPSQLTKNRDPHRLHLHPLALQVLEDRRKAWAYSESGGEAEKAALLIQKGGPNSGLVFPAPRSGREIDTFTDIKAAVIDNTKGGSERPLTDWTWHDFRRSFASALGEAGIPEAVADAVLNHRQAATRGGVLGVYQRSSRWPEQVKAMELWGRLLADALSGRKPDGMVVPMIRTG